jgi:hypothetical protein
MIVVSPRTQNPSLSALITLHVSPIMSPSSTASHGRAGALAPFPNPATTLWHHSNHTNPEERRRREEKGREGGAEPTRATHRRGGAARAENNAPNGYVGVVAWHGTVPPHHYTSSPSTASPSSPPPR